MLRHVKSSDFDEQVLENDKVILVDFFATWCPPCKMLSPVLEKIASSRADFDIAKINIDEEQALAMKYRVEAVPTMIVFKEGNPVEKIVGYVDEDSILDLMAKYI